MKTLTIIAVSAAMLVFAGGASAGRLHSSHRQFHEQYGWDIPAAQTKNNPQCHRYTMKVSGGRGFARIHSIKDGRANILQMDSGTKKGYVCFPDHGRLELGKKGDPGIRVKLGIANRGTWIFEPGDRGRQSKGGWLRTWWDI